MCGISGVWGGSEPNLELATAMAKRLAHRGPDDTGTGHLDNLSVAHCRLAIIDVDGGSQPISSGTGQGLLVANGMIYNDRALRDEYNPLNYKTNSDSESILHNCLTRGSDGVSNLDGMFAFIMATPERIIVARDPIGIKPLYLGKRGESFCFASEIKALSPYVENIVEFPPGHVFDSSVGLRAYYTLPTPTDQLKIAKEAEKAIRETLTRSIEKRLRSDVPLGVFLSGGLDSSIIAAVASQFCSELKSFSVGLEGSPDLIAARRVAEYLGTEHHEYVLTPEEIMQDLPLILYHLESFDVDLVRSAVPCYYVSRLAREHVKVVLTGEGADELFAGYDYHKSYKSPVSLQAELHRSVKTMHNINLQRVDRMTMAHGLEARVPFLDKEMLSLAFRIPAALKLPQSTDTEKWVLRKAFEDLLPAEIVWRDKEQFDQGSGIGQLLEAHVTETGSLYSCNYLSQGASNGEEELYRELMLSKFDEPAKVLPLVAHWADDRRVGDTNPEDSHAGLSANQRELNDSTSDVTILQDFSAVYDLPSPRAYMKCMSELDYRTPHIAQPIIAWCIDELRRFHERQELTILDVCAGYGINGALLQCNLSLDDLYDYFTGHMCRGEEALIDQLYFEQFSHDSDLKVVGLDVASQALGYGRNAGFIHDSYAVDLEREPLPDALKVLLPECSLCIVTGGFSFVGANTFDKILSGYPSTSPKPWIVGFPTLHCDMVQLIDVLHQHDYVIQPTQDWHFRQRRFANADERMREREVLSNTQLKTFDTEYFEARLLLAQPTGMRLLPQEVLMKGR